MSVNTERDIGKQVDKCFTYRESRSCNYRVKLFISGIALWHVYIRHETWLVSCLCITCSSDRTEFIITFAPWTFKLVKPLLLLQHISLKFWILFFGGFSLVKKGNIWGNNFPMFFNPWRNFDTVKTELLSASDRSYIANELIQILRRVNFSPLINTLPFFDISKKSYVSADCCLKSTFFGENCSLENNFNQWNKFYNAYAPFTHTWFFEKITA